MNAQTKKQNTTIKKILVPIDFSPCSANALREAIFIAKMWGAKIELIHVVTPVYITSSSSEALIPFDDSYYAKLMLHAEKAMNKIAKNVESNETISVGCKTSLDTVYTGILNYAKKLKVDLIIMGTHGTSGIKEFFVGSNAFSVVNKAACPVITVTNKTTKKGFKTIVLPIRAELNTRQKVNFVSILAKSMISNVLIAGYAEKAKEKATVKQYIKQVEAFLDNLSIANSSVLLSGDNFTKEVIDFATKNKADLIGIMKNHNFSIDQLLKGSYAQQFINHSKIPVLSMPDTLEFEYRYQNPLLGY